MNIILIFLLLHSLFQSATDTNSTWTFACTKSKTLVLNVIIHNWYVAHFTNISYQIISVVSTPLCTQDEIREYTILQLKKLILHKENAAVVVFNKYGFNNLVTAFLRDQNIQKSTMHPIYVTCRR